MLTDMAGNQRILLLPWMMRAEAKSLAVTPSTITVTADVTIVYGIRSPNAADAAELE